MRVHRIKAYLAWFMDSVVQKIRQEYRYQTPLIRIWLLIWKPSWLWRLMRSDFRLCSCQLGSSSVTELRLPKSRMRVSKSHTNLEIPSLTAFPRKAPLPSRIGLYASFPAFLVLKLVWNISLHLSKNSFSVNRTSSRNSSRSAFGSAPWCFIWASQK